MQYKTVAGSDKSTVIGVFAIFPIVGGVISLLFWVISDFTNNYFLFGGMIAVLFGLYMNYSSNRIKPSKLLIFEREQGVVSWPKSFWSLEVFTFPFDEVEGRLAMSANRHGAPLFQLWLHHPPTRTLHMLIESGALGVDNPLGYWSFISQYMDKTKPLPNVEGLGKYSTSGGLYSSNEWRQKNIAGTEFDPYVQWEKTLLANPKLDSNYEIELRYKAMDCGGDISGSKL